LRWQKGSIAEFERKFVGVGRVAQHAERPKPINLIGGGHRQDRERSDEAGEETW
jgi:hypothetical protein